LVRPGAVAPWNTGDVISGLTTSALAPVLEVGPAVSILLVGGGRGTVMIPAAIRAELRAAGLVLDAMDTGAACRTYNVLLGEGRRVAAALIAVA
jgi:uncharacterized protein